jgi:septation ring formation regulator EzrA
MDNELTHIIHEIEECFDIIEKEIYYIKWLINQLSTYPRALDHELNEFNSNNENDEYDLYTRKYGPESDIDSYDTVTHNRDNGDME